MIAVTVIGAVLFASALHGIAQTDARLAADPARATAERAHVERPSYDCPWLVARDDV